MTIECIRPRLHSRQFLAALVALVFVGFWSLVGVARAGYAAIVVDGATGKVLEAVNADEANHPASLTKMMTLYLAFQRLGSGDLTLDQKLPVSRHAASMAPTKLDLRAGQTITVRDAILGMVTKSANDAAAVMAEAIGGSEAHFVDIMNAQALLLGMTGTHFDNASGLPGPGDASTARDLVRLARALYRDFPADSAYFATREFTFRGKLVTGHNRLMDRYPGMDGLKTGFTNAAGFNLASTAVRDGRRLFAVVMGGKTAKARDDLMARLLDDGFAGKHTPEVLVAQAGRAPVRRTSRTRRALAALSPVADAHADTVPDTLREKPKARAKGTAVAARTTAACKTAKGTACSKRKHRVRHAKTATAELATRAATKKPAAAARSAGEGN